MKEPADLIGRALSDYRIVEPLGRGRMGVVHKAEDTRPQVLALKLLPKTLT
jgi:hypothetical protein